MDNIIESEKYEMSDIELVVKIPEEAYKLLKNEGVDWLGAEHILNAVANGTPLPKGHDDLIDRKELLKQPIDKANYPSNYVKIAPAIIEADKNAF